MLRRLCTEAFYEINKISRFVLQRQSARNFHLNVGNVFFANLKADCVVHDDAKSEIQLIWEDKRLSRFPYVFLRDNCLCSSCYHPTSGQRLVLIHDAIKDASQGVLSVQLKDDAVFMRWASGHESNFNLKWLEERGFVEDKAKKRKQHPVVGFRNVLWQSDHVNNMKFIEFDDVLNDDKTLYKWMKIVLTEGVCVLRNSPTLPDQLRILASRACGNVQQTMYGDIFTVKDKPGASNVAYTSGYLAMHTDQPYYYYQPGLQFLHCIVPSVEGEGINHLVDGFKVAHDFRLENPKDFDILSTLTFPYEQDGNEMFGEFQLYADRSIIGLDQHGEVERISHNNPSRANMMNHPPEETKQLYQALEKFVSLMYDKKYLVPYKLEAGDILCFNNRRVLHGRTPYIPSRSNRWLEGAYMSLDDFCARVRPLKYKYEID